ncbi:MAG TPA: FlgO family outer membrane protein [Thermodesulfobacteriota bacterium]|nr:FlgO family outer membrane protein [Thermodesulfobacteriota bacterium]
MRKIGFILVILFLGSCAAPSGRLDEGGAIAVWKVEDLSPAPGQPDLGEVFSDRIVETLKKGNYSVVERKALALALEELRLGTTSLADESTRLRLGKIVGARWMIFGGYMTAGGRMRVDLRLVEVETGKVKKAVQKTSSSNQLEEWMSSVGKAAEDLL